MRNTCCFFCLLLLSLTIINKGYGQASGFGVNLSGMEFNGTPSVPTASEMNYYNSKGLKFIRVPFLWERIQPTLGAGLNTTYLGQLDGIIAAAKTYGMSVMIDMHNYARYPYNGSVIDAGTATTANYQDVWTKIASHYMNETTIWGYDIMHEPNTLGGANWQNMAQAAITGIRSVDNKHVIVIEGDNWSHGNTWVKYNDGLKNLTDPQNNLVYEAHQYFDKNGSGTYSNTTVAGNSANANTGVTLITPFVNWLISNNKRGIVGEYGIPNNSDTANWNTLLTNFLSYLQTNCVGGTYWAGGPAWGTYILSCEPTGSVDRPQMAVLSKYTDLGPGCVAISPTGINNGFGLDVSSSAYPNPFLDHTNIRVNSSNTDKISITVSNVEGVYVFTSDYYTNEDIQIGDQLLSGVYIIRINYKGQFKVIKLVKMN
jgi:endoglucanase